MARPAKEESSLNGRRILIAEDQALIAMELRDYLHKAGVTVIGPVARLDKALSKAEEEAMDAALVDVDLNGERCWPVADALARRNIPFALTTGFASAMVTPERFAGRPVLAKPYREKDVLAMLASMLARRGA